MVPLLPEKVYVSVRVVLHGVGVPPEHTFAVPRFSAPSCSTQVSFTAAKELLTPPNTTICPVAASYAIVEMYLATGLVAGLCCTQVGVKVAVCAWIADRRQAATTTSPGTRRTSGTNPMHRKPK